jgi:DNA-binding beta-propeller fold protein YncE
VALLALAIIFVSVAASPWRGPSQRAAVFPASLIGHVSAPSHAGGDVLGGYAQPADVVELGGWLFFLDTGNSRILVQDRAGSVQRVIDGSSDEIPALRGPMAMATDGRYLYVANSGASEIVILEPGGSLVKTLDLPRDAVTGIPARPIGLAVGPAGDMFVSDPDSHRVFHYGPDGVLLQTLGSGARSGGSDGFNAPGGVALDALGNLYVADILNGRVVKLSAEGAILQQFGRLGDTAGTFSRPKDVAVDAAGNLYVSDSLLAAVQVFGPSGEYLGFIGREDPGDPESKSLFTAPSGLSVAGDRLYVVDRFEGLFAYQLPH